MRDKYNATLDHIIAIPQTSYGTFTIGYKVSSASLGLTVNTFHRHLKKLLAWQSINIVYKGGSLLPSVYKDIIMDADRHNDGRWQLRRDPNNFLSTIYSVKGITQQQRESVILRDVLGWSELELRHFLWWSNASHRQYAVNPHGLSEETTVLLRQFIRYIAKSKFGYYSDEYDGYMDSFETLRNAHGIL